MSLLALLYHSTVPNFRDEGHLDDRLAFKRFNVQDEKVQNACLRVDIAGYRLRKNETGPAIETEMIGACTSLFKLLEPELEAMVSKKPPTESATPQSEASETLLAAVYQLFHSKSYRAQTPATQVSALPPSLQPAWESVRRALDDNTPGTEVRRELTALCDRLAYEFTDPVWKFVW